MAVKLGSTGVRGIFFELTPEIVLKLSQAFSTYIGVGNIAVASDTRPSGKFIIESAISGLMGTGSTVHDYGILPTPILQWIIKEYKFNGGISISGGHNSFEWNSLIFLNSEGAYLSEIEVEEFFSLYHSGHFLRKRFNKLGAYNKSSKYISNYFKNITETNGLSKNKFKFSIDCSNGASSRILHDFSRSLNIELVPIFCGGNHSFQKDPEPNLSNAEILSTVVKETKCDGGFLLNSDGSRVLVVDETGQPFSEELTLPLFSRILLEKEKTNIVTTYSTSKLVDRVAKNYNVKVYRTDVGPPSVLQTAIDMKASIGGEGSGSIVYTPFSYGFDSFYFIKKIVEYLSEKNVTLSSLVGEFDLPRTYKKTITLPATSIYSILGKIEKSYPAKIKLKDGFYFEDRDEWLCVRASSTMSMIRIVGEGKNILEQIEKIKEQIK